MEDDEIFNSPDINNTDVKPKKKLISSMERNSLKRPPTETVTLKGTILPKVKTEAKSVVLTMADRYRKAWDIVYNNQQQWRKKEIDVSKSNGTFGTTRWDDDFVRQVTALAEKDDPLAV